MAKTAILAVKIISDASNAGQGFDQAASGVDRFQAGVQKAAAVATAATAGLVAIGAASVRAASDAQQAAGAVESVFGNAAREVMEFSKSATTAVGLSAGQYNELASVLGAQLKNLGIAQTELGGTTNDLITLGADLAATFGGTTADAVSALSALFRGEMDPIEKYGVTIKQADINARLAAQGMGELEGEAKRQAETQAKLAMVYEQAGGALGQYQREQDTAAGAQQRMNAEIQQAKENIGNALLPVVAELATAFSGLASWIGNNTGLFYGLVAVIGGLAAVLWTINAAMTAYTAVSGLVAAVKGIETAAWLANAAAVWAATWPILAIIAIIAAVVAVVILIIKNLDTLRGWWDIAFEAGRTAIQAVWSFLQQVGSWISGAFTATVSAIGNVFSTAFGIAKKVVEALLAPIRAVISAVQSLISWIGKIKFPDIGGFLSKLNPFSLGVAAPSLAPSSAARVAASPFVASPFAGGQAPTLRQSVTNVTVHISGAIDPVETGKQVQRALTGSRRTRGLVNAVKLSGDRETY